MSKGINKVILVGNLGADPELKYTASGTQMCKFTLATDESYRDRDGNKVEKTQWHKIIVWAKLAEICGQYLGKGKQVYIEGSIEYRSWDKDDGTKGYMTEINAREVVFMSGGNGQQNSGQQAGGGYGQGQGQPPNGSAGANNHAGGGQQQGGYTQHQGGYGGPPDDDIPF